MDPYDLKNATPVQAYLPPYMFPTTIHNQPEEDPTRVYSNGFTRFALAPDLLWLLAHIGSEEGRLVNSLEWGEDIRIEYSNGRTATFRVYSIQDYQARSPKDIHSNFQRVDEKGNPLSSEILTAEVLFDDIYTKPINGLVFQVCIEREGESAWGRRFVFCRRIDE